jgi:hypothetical protein
MADFAFESMCSSKEIPMGRSNSGDRFERTDLFDPSRNDINPPNDNFSDARLPQRQQRTQGDQTFRLDDGRTLVIRDSNVTVNIYNGGDDSGYDRRPVRVGSGRGSYCPEYNEYANSRQAYQEEAWLNRGDDRDRQRYPIPNCRQQHQRYSDSGYYDDRGPSRYGDVRAVSAGDYDYDRRDGRQGGNFLDRIFDGVGQFARGIGDVLYEAQPIIQTWAQIEMMKQGGRFGNGFYGGYNTGYYDRPYNPWNSSYNRNLISYNNNSRYYDNNPSWLFG